MSDKVRSLLKSLPPTVNKSAKEIIFDYSSGSQELNEKILLLLLKVRSEKTFKKLVLLFSEVFTEFAVIQNTLQLLNKRLTASNLQKTKDFIRLILDRQNSRFEKIFEKIRSKIFRGIKILTFSNSYTCLKLFEKILENGYDPVFYITESKPGGEGRIFFEKLSKICEKTNLILDKNLKKIISEIDIVIVGADKIFPEHFFINKIGTKKLAELAKKNSKPFYVVGLKEKIKKSDDIRDEKKFLYRKKDKLLFEKIGISLVTEIFIA